MDAPRHQRKVARRIRREANRLLARRRYRERIGKPTKGDVKRAQVWSIRVGPVATEHAEYRHGPGGAISKNHEKKRAAYEAGRLAAHNARVAR